MPRKGAVYAVTPGWKMSVLKRLAAARWNKARLADELGVSRTAVGNLLGRAKTSTLVPDVERVLGMPSTMIGTELTSGDKFQKIGETGEVVRKPRDTDEPWLPETHLVPVPAGFTPYKGPAGPLAMAADLVALFAALSPKRQERALVALKVLLAEQEYADTMAEHQESRQRLLDDKAQIFLRDALRTYAEIDGEDLSNEERAEKLKHFFATFTKENQHLTDEDKKRRKARSRQ